MSKFRDFIFGLFKPFDDKNSIENQIAELKELEAQGESAIPKIIEFFSHEHADIHLKAKKSVMQFGESAIPYLIEGLANAKWHVRYECVQIMGELKVRSAVAQLVLLAFSKDEAFYLKKNAIWALGEINDPCAIQPLCIIVEDKDESDAIRAEALKTLGKMEDCRAQKSISAAMEDPDFRVREAARAAFCRLEDCGAIKVINVCQTKNGLNSAAK